MGGDAGVPRGLIDRRVENVSRDRLTRRRDHQRPRSKPISPDVVRPVKGEKETRTRTSWASNLVGRRPLLKPEILKRHGGDLMGPAAVAPVAA